MLGDAEGAMGFLAPPAPETSFRWAGFVDDDAVLVATASDLYRADSAAAALSGAFRRLGPLPTDARLFASAGKWVVAASRTDPQLFFVSRDGGARFAPAKRPPGDLADVAVRGDGAVVVAIEGGATQGAPVETRFATLHVRRASGPWVSGPVANEGSATPLLRVNGDTISSFAPANASQPASSRTIGLDAAGVWVPIKYENPWLYAFGGNGFSIGPPPVRPGFPEAVPESAASNRSTGALRAVVAGLTGCGGVTCLRRWHGFFPGYARLEAFSDGVCAAADVEERSDAGATYRACRQDAPAVRATSLLIAGPGKPRVAHLPPSCAEGRVLSTDLAAFVVCGGGRGGNGVTLALTPRDTFVEVGPDLGFRFHDHRPFEIESASDGTTVLTGPGAAVCRGSEPCAILPADVVRARPLRGRRALVARRGESDHELILEVFGESRPPLKIHVDANVLELGVDEAGHVSLWTSRRVTRVPPFDPPRAAPGVDVRLVRADGTLVAAR